MRIEVAGTIFLKDLQCAYRAMWPMVPKVRFVNSQGSGRGWLIPLFCLIALAILVLMQSAQPGTSILNADALTEGLWPFVLITVVGLIVLCVGFYVFYLYRRWKALHVDIPRFYATNEKVFQRVLVIDDVGFVVKTQDGRETAYSWDDILRYQLDEWYVLLIEKAVKNLEVIRRNPEKPRLRLLHILPRHFFSDTQFQELCEFLTKRFEAARTN